MLAVVTTRLQLPHVLREAARRISATGGLPLQVCSFTTLSDAVTSLPGAAFLVLDMAAVSPTEDVDEYAIWWKTKNGASQIIVINAQHPTEALGEQLFYVSAHSAMRLIGHKEALAPELWVELFLAHPFATEMEYLRRSLEDGLLTHFEVPEDVPNYELVFQLFNLSPKMWRISDFLHTDSETTAKAQRNKFGTYFRKAGQACPRDLITAFRLLIFLRLTEVQRAQKSCWTPRHIANHLQQGNAVGLRAFFKERTGLTLAELTQLRSTEIAGVIITMLTPSVQRTFRERVHAVHAVVSQQEDRQVRPSRLFKSF